MIDNEIENFIDIEFPPIMASIYDPEENFPFDSEIIWKRPKDFLQPEKGRHHIQIFNDTISPTDVVEGNLGDSWFASALACLAEKPALLQKLFISDNFSQHGVYKVQICKSGIWKELTIDDYFPCSISTGGMALFSRSSKQDMWVLLLEKAYAKLHRNYYTLRGGLVSEALSDLTGSPISVIHLDAEETQSDI